MNGAPAPTFSVIVAAYQAAAFISDAVHSALDQDPRPLEVIIGDDGSTDDLAGALQRFGHAVRRVRISHAGEAAAKNAAAAVARGDFLAFLDADDRFLPGRLSAMAALATERPDLDVITTDAHLVHDGKIVGRCYGPTHPFVATDQRTAILRSNFVLGLAAVRRARFVEIGGFDPAVEYTTDWDLWIRLVLTGSTIGLVPEALAEYRLHEESMSTRRAAMSLGRLTTLARAAARDDLTDFERSVVAAAERIEHAGLARTELRDALIAGNGSARRAALRVAASNAQPPPTRLKALATAVAPGLVARRLRAREEESFVTVGDRRLPRT
jgi:glycosyltransferase involved in cell wall biosynthesis